MKTLLLSLSLSLIAAVWAQTLPAEEETQNVSRTWYLKAITSDKEIPLKKLGSMSVTPMTVDALEGGSLVVNVTVLVAGQCRELSNVLEKTDDPGKYTAYGGKHVVYIIMSPVEDHYILYSVAHQPLPQFRMAQLLGRYPEINVEALEDFERVVEARGLNTGNIVIPKQTETCSPASD